MNQGIYFRDGVMHNAYLNERSVIFIARQHTDAHIDIAILSVRP